MRPPGASRATLMPGRRERGFTLLELIVVLVLAGALLSLVVPSLFGALESGRLRACAAEVRAAFNLARTQAASGGRERAVTFHLDRGAYAIDGEAAERVVPEGVAIAAARRGAEIVEQGDVRIRFYPDGSAEEAEIVLTSGGGGRLRVTVDPLTGLAEAGT